MQFEYLYTMQATGTVDIEDIGNFCLSLTNDLFREYIIIVKTDCGWTKVLTFGPWMVDMEVSTISCSCSLQQFEFKQDKIAKIVDKLLNGPALISQARVVDEEYAKSRVRNLGELI